MGLSWSPSGERVAVCSQPLQKVFVFDRGGKLILTIPHGAVPWSLAFAPDEKSLAIVGEKYLQICGLEDGREMQRRPLFGDGGMTVSFFSPNGRYVACGGRFGKILIVDVDGNRIHRELQCDRPTSTLAFSPDGAMLASGHSDSVIRLWSMDSGRMTGELTEHERAIRKLAFSPDGRTLLSASSDETIRVWSVNQKRGYGIVHRVVPLEVGVDPSGKYCNVSLSSEGRRLAIAYADRFKGPILMLWDLQGPAPVLNRK
jgi:WD40 repeat protein